MKICSKCKTEKSIEYFSKDSFKKDGLRTQCKECDINYRKNNFITRKQYQKEYASKDFAKESSRVRALQYYYREKETRLTLKEQGKEYTSSYHERHRLEISIKDKIYRETYPEKVKQFRKNWSITNKHKICRYSSERRAKKLRAMPIWANEKYINLFFEIAKLEEERTNQKCHVDHIVPLKSQLVCGLHVEYNLQVLLAKDNISKGNRFWPDMPNNVPEILEFYGLK